MGRRYGKMGLESLMEGGRGERVVARWRGRDGRLSERDE